MAALNLSLYPPSVSSTVEPDHGITLDYADSGKLHRRGLYAAQHYVVTLNWDLLTLAQRDYLEDFIFRYRLETVTFTLDGHDYTGELIGGPIRRWVSGQLYGLTAQYRAVRVASVDPIAAIIAAYAQASVWYDPSDMATMWQDTAGTIPAVPGLAVARIDDKGNLGLHATQSNPAARPTLQQDGQRRYLQFAAAGQSLVIPTGMPVPTTGSAAFAGFRRDVDTGGSEFLYYARGFNPFDPEHRHPMLLVFPPSRGNVQMGNQNNATLGDAVPAGADFILSGHMDEDNLARRAFLNGVLYATATAPALGDAGDNPTGQIGGNYLGRIYEIVHIQHGITDEHRRAIESAMAAKAGVGI